ALRGMGFAMVPTLVSVVGVCGLRILWLHTIFAWNPTVEVLFLSYPVTWVVTGLVQFLCFVYIRKKHFAIQESKE
ncbi:MAG: MATE family efflux transporter, partial [Ruminiclostridium sp.]|nr:MATE family efflux transporter [Ruminiclostridium sp.]